MALATNCLVHLIGLPGVGKLTIARELAGALPAHLVDNHAINNLIFPLMHVNKGKLVGEETWSEIRKIRAVVLNVITALAPREDNYIFTNALYGSDAGDLAMAQRVREAIEARDGTYIPVVLTCAPDEHLARFTEPTRRERMKMTNKKHYDSIYAVQEEPLRQNLPHEHELDVTALTPAEAAAAIKVHVEKVCA